jgi:hypothetical protein
MVLVLAARGSSTSTSTAGAEYEYENQTISRPLGHKIVKKCNFKTRERGTIRKPGWRRLWFFGLGFGGLLIWVRFN